MCEVIHVVKFALGNSFNSNLLHASLQYVTPFWVMCK
jgi:hypothetical protein